MTSPPAQKDPLGYDVYAQTLWARIQTALNKDKDGKLLGDDPLVVGLFGEWGAGKSHLLKLMYTLAEGQSKRDVSEHVLTANSAVPSIVTVPVYFQPWKYEHEVHLHIPLAVHIADALHEHWKKLPTFTELVLSEADKAPEKLAKIKAAYETVKNAWGSVKNTVHSKTAALVASGGDVGLMSVGAPPLLSIARKKLISYTSPADDEATDNEITDDEGVGEGEDTTSNTATSKTSKPADKAKQATQEHLAHRDDGLSFYRVQKILTELTRPKAHKVALTAAGVADAKHIQHDIHINFVIFIDDLDRCLPEKAVQSLELIKTIFNVESFAFVLALDDEVIERGIGHRYQAYNFAGKKPEMPITGFEYLEKIVHLPFRLPALTYTQAYHLIRIKELDIQAAPLDTLDAQAKADSDKRLFFTYSEASVGMRAGESLGIDERDTDFVEVLLSSFDQYVPRKLIRAIELLYQVRDIADKRGKGFHLKAQGETKIDQRILFGLLLLQLFQPEFFRVLRRRKAAMRSLLAAFLDKSQPLGDGSDVSEARLWQWACMYIEKSNSIDNFSRPADVLNPAAEFTSEAPYDQLSALKFISISLKRSAIDTYTAQQIRLPVADRLVAHLQIERHAFNPFKLLKQLSDYLDESKISTFNINDYLEFLSEDAVLIQAKTPYVDTKEAPPVKRVAITLPATMVQTLFERLTSSDVGVQGEVADLLAKEPYAGKKLTTESADLLHKQLQAWLQQNEHSIAAKQTLLKGLQHLAPSLTAVSAKQFWQLVDGCVTLPSTPNTPTDEPALASLYCDVRSMLGQDERFNPAKLYLLNQRFANNTVKEEPIVGFVYQQGGSFTSGHTDQNDNPVNKKSDAGAPFYMARNHTTVDQYAAFLASEPHKNEALWDTTGWQWVNGTLDTSKLTNKRWQTHLNRRTSDARHTPHDWAQQRRVGSRAVHSITWFEARAYARWLNEQLKPELTGVLAMHQVRLPTELQWEYAATSGGSQKPFPWGDDDKNAAKRANINSSNIGHASVAGCFAPNEAGLWDMAGNLWQWQDGLYQRVPDTLKLNGGKAATEPLNSPYKRLDKAYQHHFGKEWSESDCAALRGGSWFDGSDGAAAASRYGSEANDWGDDFGFRVVLSLAENES